MALAGRAFPKLVKGVKDLCDWVGRDDIRVVVEVGVYVGDSTQMFANFFRDAVIYAVDPWEAGYDNKDAIASRSDMAQVEAMFDQNVRHFPNIIKVKRPSIVAAKNFLDKGVDLIYVDACHQYPSIKQDIQVWKPKVRRVFAGHDFANGWHGVDRAVREEFGQPDRTFVDGSWAVRCK